MSPVVHSRRNLPLCLNRDPLELLVVSKMPMEARPFTSPTSPLRKELVQPVETIDAAIGLIRRGDRRISHVFCSIQLAPLIIKNPLPADITGYLSLFSFNGEDRSVMAPREKLGIPILRSLGEVEQLLASRFAIQRAARTSVTKRPSSRR